MPYGTNAQGCWYFYAAYDRTTRDYCVIVQDEVKNSQIIGHEASHLAAEARFLRWLEKGDDAATGQGVQE